MRTRSGTRSCSLQAGEPFEKFFARFEQDNPQKPASQRDVSEAKIPDRAAEAKPRKSLAEKSRIQKSRIKEIIREDRPGVPADPVKAPDRDPTEIFLGALVGTPTETLMAQQIKNQTQPSLEISLKLSLETPLKFSLETSLESSLETSLEASLEAALEAPLSIPMQMAWPLAPEAPANPAENEIAPELAAWSEASIFREKEAQRPVSLEESQTRAEGLPEAIQETPAEDALDALAKRAAFFGEKSEAQPEDGALEESDAIAAHRAEQIFLEKIFGRRELKDSHNGAFDQNADENLPDESLSDENFAAGKFSNPDLWEENFSFQPAAAPEQALILSHEPAPHVHPAEVVRQIIEQVKVSVSDTVSEVRVLLRPETLGNLSLKVVTENGLITAQFLAENQRVKEILEANFNTLRDALQEQGVGVSQLSVSVGQDNASGERGDLSRRRQAFISAANVRPSFTKNGINKKNEINNRALESSGAYGSVVNYRA
jgi:flagellar hook-length control protein FliK